MQNCSILYRDSNVDFAECGMRVKIETGCGLQNQKSQEEGEELYLYSGELGI